MHEEHEVEDVAVEMPSEVRRRWQRAAKVDEWMHSAPSGVAVLQTAGLSAAAGVASKQLRLALAEADLLQEEVRELLDANFKTYFDPRTDELRVAPAEPRGVLLRTLVMILKPVLDAAIAAAVEATAFPCQPTHVHCGIWDWYLRGLAQEEMQGVPQILLLRLLLLLRESPLLVADLVGRILRPLPRMKAGGICGCC